MCQLFKTTLFSLLVTVNPTIYSMHYAKKAFSATCTAAHWGISTAPFWAKGIAIVTQSEEDISNIVEASSFEAPHEVEQFIRTQLAEKLPHANSIKIRYCNELQPNANYAAIYSHALGVFCTHGEQVKELFLLDQNNLGLYTKNRSPLEHLLAEKAFVGVIKTPQEREGRSYLTYSSCIPKDSDKHRLGGRGKVKKRNFSLCLDTG